MGTLTSEDFEKAIFKLFEYAKSYNEKHKNAKVDFSINHARHPYLSTAAVYITYKEHLDIIYNTSFQVPVIYYRQVVNPSSAMFSMTEHPITGLPCYFLHPCQTAEVMKTINKDGHFSSADTDYGLVYMKKWLGAYNHHLADLGLYLEFFANM